VLLITCLASLAGAQEFRSTLTGRVLDAQDAGVPAATIRATQLETGSQFNTVADEEGRYAIPFVAPGTYRLTAEKEGFKRFERAGIQVSP
jgi:hypothetical protein